MAHSCDFGEVVKKRRERRLVSSSSSEHLAHPLPQKDIINARDTSELRKSKSNERGTVTHGICVSHYFKRLFKYATERNFITRQQAKRACNKEFTRSGVPLGWKTPKRFVSFMKSFLSIPRTTARSWVEIFVTRLVTEKTKLLPIHTEAIKKIVCCFVNEYPVEAANETIPQSIHSLFEYLESHNIDIDNSLIGLEASKKFREKFLENTKNPSKIPLHENLLSETAREDLLNRFTKWSMCNDANLAVEVKEYITMLEQSAKNTIKCGDLVIVKTKRSLCPVRHYVLKDELRCLEYIPELENNATVMELHELVRKAEIYEESDKWDSERIVIGRVLQFDGAGILRISCDSIERVHVVVSLNQVFFFTDEMNSLAVSENARELIEDESDGIRVIMEDATEQILREYLQAHGTPYYVSVLDKTCRNTGQFESFLDFVPLQELLETIEEIIANPTLLLDTVNIKLAPLREKLLLKFAKIFVYHPARAGISERLSIEKYELLAMNLLANYQERCSNMIVLLKNQVYMFFNGMQKLLLNEKCLKLLRKYLKPILEKEDFTTSIDNFNLLTSVAKHNIDIITQLQTDEVKLLEELIIPIREELLPYLEDYKTKAVQIVLTQLRYNSNMSKDGEDFDLEQITNEISVALKNNAPSHELYFVERLVGDIACIDRFTGSVDCMSKLVRKYIETMKCELQTIIEGANTSISSSDSSKKKRNGAKRTSATRVSSSSLIFVEVDLFAYELFSVSDLATLNPSDVQAINNSFPVKVLEMNDFDSSADAPEELLKRSDFQQTNIIEPVKTLKSSNYCENSFVVPQKLPKKNRVVFEYNFSFDDSDSTGINSMSDMDSIGDETISIYINT